MKHDNLPKLSVWEMKMAYNLYDDITVKINGYEFRLETDRNNKFTEYSFCKGWDGYEISKREPHEDSCTWLKNRSRLGNYTWVNDYANDWKIKTIKTAKEILLHLWFTREEKTNEET